MSLETFISFHYPYLIHKPSEEKKKPIQEEKKPPSGTTDPGEPKKFERLKAPTGYGILSVPNDLQLDNKLEINSLLAEQCFEQLLSWLGASFDKIVDKIFSIFKFIDIGYLISAAQNAILKQLRDLLNSVEDLAIKESIQKSIDDISDCVPPEIPEAKSLNSGEENYEDIAKRTFYFGLLNIDKIPYLFSADFLQQLKKKITELILQIIVEFTIQFINQIIKKVTEFLCSPKDVTAKIASPSISTPEPTKPSIDNSPADALSSLSEKCSYIELFSSNKNISKEQIYSVVRDLYNIKTTNNEFDSYFAGLSSILDLEQTINTLSNNIDDTLYAIIKNYSSSFESLGQIIFNKSTTKNFFLFLSRYVDLMPCYEQLLIDKRSADYCYDENPVKNLNDQEILDKANDLLGQLTGLCDIVNGASLNDKLQDLSFLDQQAKDAISAGATEVIKTAHENFARIKKGFLNSFETIDLLGDFIIKQDGAILKNFLKTDFKTKKSDAIIKIGRAHV